MDDIGNEMNGMIMKLIGATIQVIVLAAFAIPTIISFANGPGMHPGDTWDYDVSTNLPADIYVSGTQQQYATVTDHHIHIVWPKEHSEGKYELIITAYTHQPEQSATKVINLEVVGAFEYKELILVIPTMMIIQVIVYLIKPIRSVLRGREYYDDGIEQDISNELE